MTKEVWKDIPDYESLYQASTEGRIRSVDRSGIWTGRGYRSMKGRILKPGRNTKFGHVTVAVGKNNSVNVHVLVLQTFVGPRPTGYDGIHLDGDASNNKLSNLKWGTRSENNEMMTRHGRQQFTEKDIRYIRSTAYKYWGAQTDLAKHYDVSISIINSVAMGRNYSHVI